MRKSRALNTKNGKRDEIEIKRGQNKHKVDEKEHTGSEKGPGADEGGDKTQEHYGGDRGHATGTKKSRRKVTRDESR